MLRSLSSALKKGFDKIAGAVFVDKKTILAVVKDLQRALIQADVNVHLVKELGDKIKKEAENENIKEIEKKEHLTKLLHDEVIDLLGGEKYELKLEKGKNVKMMLVGLYGAGKCVHGETKILLNDGEIIQAKELYEKYSKKLNEKDLGDGKIINLEKENLFVPSFNPKTLKIENKKVTNLWELEKNKLIKVNLDQGNDYSIKVTPEHPFFVLKNGKVIQKRADQLTEDDFVAIPKEYKLSGKSINLFNDMKKLNFLTYLTREETKNYLSQKGKSIKEINKDLKLKINYCKLTQDLKKGVIPIELIEDKEINFLKIKDPNSRKIITAPIYLTKEYAEFLGYLIGDGHIEKNYVEIITQDLEVISRIIELSKMLFNIIPSIKKDKRTKNVHRLILASKTLVELLRIFNLTPGKKGRQLSIPKQILLSDDEIIRGFIRSYFDCDSFCSLNRRVIELVSESQILIQQINMLLRRFKINSSISKKIVNGLYYWRLMIKSKSAEIYAEKIGYLIQYKQKRAENFKRFGEIQGSGKEDMIPIGKFLKELRLELGFSIGEIQSNAVYSYGIYERKGFISRNQLMKLFYYYSNTKKGIFYKILNDISNESYKKNYSNEVLNGILSLFKNENLITVKENVISLNKNSKQILQQYQCFNSTNSLNILNDLSNSNVCWVPVKNVEKIINSENYVYDLTVEDNHSFVAEGFIVHNTTSASKLALYYSKRGFKVALLGLDVHRPAAMQQLEQLGEKINVPVFVDKDEKDAVKIYDKFREELKEFDLVIIDSAGRHSLDVGLVKEIKDFGKVINPDYRLLVIQADIGQTAKVQAEEFQKAVDVNGVIITRMDSTAKAGGALTACKETNAPVFFIGTGEKPNEFESFNPKSFVSRLLGLGDLEGLLEKVQSAVDEKSQKKLGKKLEEGKLDLRDFQEQLKQMQGFGSLSKITEMIPGLSGAKIPEGMLGGQEEKLKKWPHIIDSMTQEEIENPEILEKETSRLSRIAKGSGATTTDVRQILKQYKLLKEMASGGMGDMDVSEGLSSKQMQKLAKKFGKKMRF